MYVSSKLFTVRPLGYVSLRLSHFLGCLFLLAFTLSAASLPAQDAGQSLGVVWHVRSLWRIAGKSAPIQIGDAIQPGSLLQPGDLTAAHSITILLPDGQRLFYECSSAEDCARGFRVSSLTRLPEPSAVNMLMHIRSQLIRDRRDLPAPDDEKQRPLPRDEVVAARDADGRIEIGGLATRLPNGRYTYDLRPLDGSHPVRVHRVFEKNSSSIDLSVPASGLYIVTIADESNMPRIDLFIAVVEPAQTSSATKSFLDAKALIRNWNQNYGWPIHDVQWAYLESLMLDPDLPAASPAQTQSAGSGQSAPDEIKSSALTAEPTFVPSPGTLKGASAIALRCDTPDAVMHYTLDGSQPMASSQVYSAPIVLKEGIMTIKSFASAAGKKDSAVVTGTFLARQP